METLEGKIEGDFIYFENRIHDLILKANIKLSKINISDGFRSMDNFGQKFMTYQNIKGTATANIYLQSMWDRNYKFYSPSLSMNTDLMIENGELNEFEPMYNLSEYVSLEELKNVKFATLKNKIRIENEKIIIWTHFVKTASALEKILKSYSTGTIHGGKDLEIRNKTLSDFKKESGPRILIATYGTAKEGLTLTQANHAIYFERNFSLSDYLQSQDRIHRISQTKISYIYNIITKNSIEEWVESLVNAKQMAAQYVQGDILLNEYQEKINYSFNNILQDILKGNK